MEKGSVHLSYRHTKGPIIPGANCIANQYTKAECVRKWKITCEEPDNTVFLSDHSVVVVVFNFVKTFDDRNVLIGQRFEIQEDFYLQPIPSSSLCEYKVSSLSNLQAWDLKDVWCKAVKLPENFPHDDSFVVFPLIRKLSHFI